MRNKASSRVLTSRGPELLVVSVGNIELVLWRWILWRVVIGVGRSRVGVIPWLQWGWVTKVCCQVWLRRWVIGVGACTGIMTRQWPCVDICVGLHVGNCRAYGWCLGKGGPDWNAAAPWGKVQWLHKRTGWVPSLGLTATASTLWSLPATGIILPLLPLHRAVARNVSRLTAEVANPVFCRC